MLRWHLSVCEMMKKYLVLMAVESDIKGKKFLLAYYIFAMYDHF